MGMAGQKQVPECKREEAAKLDLLLRTPGLQNSRANIIGLLVSLYTNIQDISAAETTTQRFRGTKSPLENTLFLKAREKKKAKGLYLEICS